MKPAPKVEPTPENFVHEVKWTGESLSIIAGWYTGDIQNWKALGPFNPHIKPDVIRVGDRIVIPRSMMKTQEPMPKDYVDSFVPQATGQGPSSPSRGEASSRGAETVRSQTPPKEIILARSVECACRP